MNIFKFVDLDYIPFLIKQLSFKLKIKDVLNINEMLIISNNKPKYNELDSQLLGYFINSIIEGLNMDIEPSEITLDDTYIEIKNIKYCKKEFSKLIVNHNKKVALPGLK